MLAVVVVLLQPQAVFQFLLECLIEIAPGFARGLELAPDSLDDALSILRVRERGRLLSRER
jgi:hypothetical protein